jgi:hypothetical protein
MKLTKIDREAFVRAVMQDVPKVDYMEQARKLVLDDSIEQLPPQLRQFALDKNTSAFIRTDTYYSWHGFNQSFTVFAGRGGAFSLTKKSQTAYDKLVEQYKAQKEQREALKERIQAVIAGCTTLKMAKERLPEFDKYLPQEREGSKTPNLPAIANIVADLTKLGWPKTAAKVAA